MKLPVTPLVSVTRPIVRRGATAFGRLTAGQRIPPSFLLVGAQRCGTTSLYKALISHPHVMRPIMTKGVNYFDDNYHRGMKWYLGYFPTQAAARRRSPTAENLPGIFEASGYYMHHPHAPRRIVETLPSVKIVAMVRDPVQRAYSAYKHEFARGFETELFERALELEDERIQPELATMLADEGYQSDTYRHQAYRRRGHYAEQLREFIAQLGRDQVHIVESERFFTEPEAEYGRLLEFLELPTKWPVSFDRFNARPGSGLSPQIESELRQQFAPHDEELAHLLGRAPAWRT